MKKYWVLLGISAYVLVTTQNLLHGDVVYHNGNEVTVIDAV